MTAQRFKVIPIQNYDVVVEDHRIENPTTNDTILDEYNQVGKFVDLSHLGLGYGNFRKVIGSIGKRLDGVPLIELVNNTMILARESAVKNNYDIGDDTYKHGFVNGHKTNTNKYSEAQIKAAIIVGAGNPNMTNKNVDDYLQSLQKQPIPTEIELEIVEIMEHGKRDAIGVATFNTSSSRYKLVIHNKETNTVTPINVFYE